MVANVVLKIVEALAERGMTQEALALSKFANTQVGRQLIETTLKASEAEQGLAIDTLLAGIRRGLPEGAQGTLTREILGTLVADSKHLYVPEGTATAARILANDARPATGVIRPAASATEREALTELGLRESMTDGEKIASLFNQTLEKLPEAERDFYRNLAELPHKDGPIAAQRDALQQAMDRTRKLAEGGNKEAKSWVDKLVKWGPLVGSSGILGLIGLAELGVLPKATVNLGHYSTVVGGTVADLQAKAAQADREDPFMGIIPNGKDTIYDPSGGWWWNPSGKGEAPDAARKGRIEHWLKTQVAYHDAAKSELESNMAETLKLYDKYVAQQRERGATDILNPKQYEEAVRKEYGGEIEKIIEARKQAIEKAKKYGVEIPGITASANEIDANTRFAANDGTATARLRGIAPTIPINGDQSVVTPVVATATDTKPPITKGAPTVQA